MFIVKAHATGGSGKSGSGSVDVQNLIQRGRTNLAFSDPELRQLANAHRGGNATLKRQIESVLTDINFHTEAGSFREGTYTLLSDEEPQQFAPRRGTSSSSRKRARGR